MIFLMLSVEKAILKTWPTTACCGQVWAFAHTFGEAAQSGGLGVWWLFPQIPPANY